MSIYSLLGLLFYFIFQNSVFSMPKNQALDENSIANNSNQHADSKLLTLENLSTLLEEDSSEDKFFIQFYYETKSFNSWLEYNFLIAPLQAKQDVRVTIETYPYGMAETFRDGDEYKFKCEHGPKECYGNKLHACTLHLVHNKTQAILFNQCLINSGSNDAGADECGMTIHVHAEPVKECAKNRLGSLLLKHYGDESKKVHFNSVPYTLLNGKPMFNFTSPPQLCLSEILNVPAFDKE